MNHTSRKARSSKQACLPSQRIEIKSDNYVIKHASRRLKSVGLLDLNEISDLKLLQTNEPIYAEQNPLFAMHLKTVSQWLKQRCERLEMC